MTLAEPESGRAEALILGSTVTEVALVVVQVSTTDWPAVIWLAAPLRLAVGAGTDGAGGVLFVPPHPAKPKPTSSITMHATTEWSRYFLLQIAALGSMFIPKNSGLAMINVEHGTPNR